MCVCAEGVDSGAGVGAHAELWMHVCFLPAGDGLAGWLVVHGLRHRCHLIAACCRCLCTPMMRPAAALFCVAGGASMLMGVLEKHWCHLRVCPCVLCASVLLLLLPLPAYVCLPACSLTWCACRRLTIGIRSGMSCSHWAMTGSTCSGLGAGQTAAPHCGECSRLNPHV